MSSLLQKKVNSLTAYMEELLIISNMGSLVYSNHQGFNPLLLCMLSRELECVMYTSIKIIFLMNQ